ncbi:DNA repair protein RecN [Ponticaulis sp.]|uniref:DNA repair protein RecN n=1 Tax=Ponticaulis sp. TaxID=2020902 RepID=UPI000B725805|nr:DNA repair protein RecN [Ponticaulis sp.]MAI89038.1 DNA repair protein RecN [Ponticaulis sp.]OUY01719.1 MAG: DNA repair protein RecN [Hyphomonadaceae bacterium TMED5]|tara:strand:+ start:50427 stop:52133 length:1707 start_codon:yes stop_codon:yes gene_type:complete
MLIAFSVRDFVLIDSLDIDVCRGFTSVTGETGAGKSIMLDALRFVLGGKADKRFIRQGAERTSVSVSFQLQTDHPAITELEERGLVEDGDTLVTFRRLLSHSGPSRIYANDQIISADFASQLGHDLVEIHGQHDGSALLNPKLHGDVLDQFAKAETLLKRVSKAYSDWADKREACDALKARQQSQDAELAQYEYMLEELDKLSPGEEEASRLTLERAMLLNSQKLIEFVTEAEDAVNRSDAASTFGVAARHIDRAMRLPEFQDAPEDNPQLAALTQAQDAIERALIELNEASIAVESARASFHHDPETLEQVEQRLFSLRAAGRKYNVDPDELAALHTEARQKLNELQDFDGVIAEAERRQKEAETAYREQADKLSALRKSSGEQLSALVQAELPPLKLEHAKFRVKLETLDMAQAGPHGQDKILFEVQTNPGAPFGALNQIASGGELARFTLALRVCLANIQSAALLVFDEADQGVGGAVAAAVGERLGRLADDRQVLAITHSPQVAASGHQHWHITKRIDDGETTVSQMNILTGEARLEEVARMLSGSEITKEARAAAERLMAEAV